VAKGSYRLDVATVHVSLHRRVERHMSASDCPICQEQISKAASGRCMHKFCYECLLTWCTAHNGCPTCRRDLEFIALDPTFDAVVEELVANGPTGTGEDDGAKGTTCRPEGDAVPSASDIVTLTIDYKSGINSGVRIAVKSGPGVRVTGVWRNGGFYAAGLRPGDVIYELNGFPCNDIRVAIDVINAAQLGCRVLTLRAHSKRASIVQKRKGSFGSSFGSLPTGGSAASLLRLLHKAVALSLLSPVGSRNGRMNASNLSQDPGTTGRPRSQERPEGPAMPRAPESAPARRQQRRSPFSRSRTGRRPPNGSRTPTPYGEIQEWQWWEEGESSPPAESYREGSTNRQPQERPSLRAPGRTGPDLTQPVEGLVTQRESPWLQTTTLEA
jgi:hypothetical protein